MYQPNVGVLPVTGVGATATAAMMSGPVSAVLWMVAIWTLVMAARTVYRMTPIFNTDVR